MAMAAGLRSAMQTDPSQTKIPAAPVILQKRRSARDVDMLFPSCLRQFSPEPGLKALHILPAKFAGKNRSIEPGDQAVAPRRLAGAFLLRRLSSFDGGHG